MTRMVPFSSSLGLTLTDWIRRDSTFRLLAMPIQAALTAGQIAVARSGLVDYENALNIQRNFHAEIVAD